MADLPAVRGEDFRIRETKPATGPFTATPLSAVDSLPAAQPQLDPGSAKSLLPMVAAAALLLLAGVGFGAWTLFANRGSVTNATANAAGKTPTSQPAIDLLALLNQFNNSELSTIPFASPAPAAEATWQRISSGWKAVCSTAPEGVEYPYHLTAARWHGGRGEWSDAKKELAELETIKPLNSLGTGERTNDERFRDSLDTMVAWKLNESSANDEELAKTLRRAAAPEQPPPSGDWALHQPEIDELKSVSDAAQARCLQIVTSSGIADGANLLKTLRTRNALGHEQIQPLAMNFALHVANDFNQAIATIEPAALASAVAVLRSTRPIAPFDADVARLEAAAAPPIGKTRWRRIRESVEGSRCPWSDEARSRRIDLAGPRELVDCVFRRKLDRQQGCLRDAQPRLARRLPRRAGAMCGSEAGDIRKQVATRRSRGRWYV